MASGSMQLTKTQAVQCPKQNTSVSANTGVTVLRL
jgi:hypothetical protein